MFRGLPHFKHPLRRTLAVALLILGVIGIGEFAVLSWRLFFAAEKPQPQLATTLPKPTAPPVAVATPVSTPPPPAPPLPVPAVDDQWAAAAERSLLALLPPPVPTPLPAPASTPAPVRREVTPESRVADLVNQSRLLRDRGDIGTSMARLRQAQAIYPNHTLIISEMALTYEKMGLPDKAVDQWRRIFEMGEKAGIYYAAAEAKLRTLQTPDEPRQETALSRPVTGGLSSEAPADFTPVLSLGNVGTTDDTGTTQPLRRLKLRVPIQARPGRQIEPREVVIQVFFYEQLKDGSVVETNANVTSSWSRRTNPAGDVFPVDWSSPDPEVLEVEYAQAEFDPKDPRTREKRNYFGFSVRLYYKGMIQAKLAEPQKILSLFAPPATLPSGDLPQ